MSSSLGTIISKGDFRKVDKKLHFTEFRHFVNVKRASCTWNSNDSQSNKICEWSFPPDFTTFETYAFNGHPYYNQMVLHFLGEVPPTGSNTFWFWNFSKMTWFRIYVPDDCVDVYKAASFWCDYASYIFPESEYVKGEV